MLTRLLAHGGAPLPPNELLAAWHLDPLLLTALGLALAAAIRDLRKRSERWRARRAAFLGGAVLVLAVALVSPLDAASRSLASAHMVQHVLLVAVAAPLLAAAALEAPDGRRRISARPLPIAGAVALAHALTLAAWHAAVPYVAALRSDGVHIAEHATFLLTAVLFWAVVAGAVGSTIPHRVLLVFGVGMTTVFLGVLMTFAPAPWYEPYASTTQPFGLEPLADQQLAGVIMWVPMAVAYVAAALTLVARWLRDPLEAPAAPR